MRYRRVVAVRTAAFVAVMAATPLSPEASDARRSGYFFMSPQTRAMQDDDMANPGMLTVLEGAELWSRPQGAAGRSCADCHGADGSGLTGAAARYPAFDEAEGKPIDLAGRIRKCGAEHLSVAPPAFESRSLVALTTFVAHKARGTPVGTGEDPRLSRAVETGRSLWHTRFGQLDLSCAQCHDDNAGRRLGSAPIPEAHPTGYPIYRLEWQSVGSLQRRIRGCLIGVRAEPFPYGSDEFVALELFLMHRARGMPMETPGVRP
jgi:sulfur-oxidizing protein SoxA